MQGGQRRPARGPAEPKAPSARRDSDINRERLVFVLTSMVGHRVFVTLRNKTVYEGLFHSCALDGDFSITLKYARIPPSGSTLSGEVINTLVIPGKEYLQVTADEVPPPWLPEASHGNSGQAGFMTDVEIAGQQAPTDEQRELVPFYGGACDEKAIEECDSLDDLEQHAAGNWDQFEQNSSMYGVVTTYKEELYTTKLDPSAIPKEKRDEADRIAREIEAGVQNAEVDGRQEQEDQDGDEEAAFSAVNRDGSSPSSKPTGKLLLSSTGPSAPLTKDNLTQHDRENSPQADGFAREHRTKRGMITAHSAHSPMRSPMITEMKRINALNLEPALPKIDDRTRNDWVNFKQSQMKPSKPALGNGNLKSQFEKDLAVLQDGADAQGRRGGKGQKQSGPSDSGQGGSSFKFNPGAKEFSFNPAAASFTPSSPQNMPASPPGNLAMMGNLSSQAKPTASNAVLHLPPATEMLQRSLDDILNIFYNKAVGEDPVRRRPEWLEATGASYKEALGQPVGGPPMMPAGAVAGQWQQAPNQMGPGGTGPQGQMQPGCQPQMVPQGFMVAPGPGGGQTMYAPMYPGTGPGTVQAQPMAFQPGMVQHGTPQAQQAGPQGMMQGGMCGGPQGQNNAMGAVPKFGAQMVPVGMVPAGGQFSPQGQMIQGQMPMQHGWVPPDGRRQMGGGAPHHGMDS